MTPVLRPRHRFHGLSDLVGGILACLPAPRISRRVGTFGQILGLLLLVMSALCGATLVHVIEYHLGFGSSGHAGAMIAMMLAHCPLRGGLAVVAVLALLTGLALSWELGDLALERTLLTARAQRLGIASPPVVKLPRRSERLVALVAVLLGFQLGFSAIAGAIWPMDPVMRMHGVVMHMGPYGAVPWIPLQCVVALLLATLLWRLERNLTVIRTGIDAVCRLLLILEHGSLAHPAPPGPTLRSLWALIGISALSRPPPLLRVQTA